MLYSVLVGVEIVISVVLVLLILLNRSKGSEMGGGFTGGSASLFGASGAASFLTKVIAVLAVVFFSNSLLLTYVANRDYSSGSVVDRPAEELFIEEGTDLPDIAPFEEVIDIFPDVPQEETPVGR